MVCLEEMKSSLGIELWMIRPELLESKEEIENLEKELS